MLTNFKLELLSCCSVILETLQNVAAGYESNEDWQFAVATQQQIRELATKVYGPESYHVQDAQRALAWLKLLQNLTATERQQLQESDKVRLQVAELRDQQKYETAIPLAQDVLATREKLFGLEHPDTADNLDYLAQLYTNMGNHARSAQLSIRALKIREKTLGVEHPYTATSLINLGLLFDNMGNYALAESLYIRALMIHEQILGPEDPKTATSLNTLALLYFDLKDFARAYPLYKSALKIREKVLGPDHPDTAISLSNLAGLYYDMGYYARAVPLGIRVLKINEKDSGPNHPDTAIALNNLAGSYERLGDYARAEPLYTRALEINEKALGPDHPDTAMSLNNLASLYDSMGDYARAELLVIRALKICEKTLGPDNLATARCLHNLAELYKDLGDYARAEPLYNRTLKIYEKASGSDQSDLVMPLNGLAGLYDTMGDYTLSEEYYTRALKICEKALGPEHPTTASNLGNLAGLYREISDYARAEPLYTRALKIREKVLGPDHPYTARSLNNLAALLVDMGDYARAEPLLIRAIKIKEKVLGPDHPDTAKSLNNLANLYNRQSDYTRAEPLYSRALKIREATLGADHIDVAESLNSFAMLYFRMGDYERAKPLLIRAIKIKEKTLGADNPDTAGSLSNLSLLHKEMGDFAQAEPLSIRALKVYEKVFGSNHFKTAGMLVNFGNIQLAQLHPHLALSQFERVFQIRLQHFQITTAIQSERQQREYAKQFKLEGYLQALLESKVPATEHYARLMLRKGIVFRRQQALRSVRDNPQIEPVFTDWQRTLTQLSQSALKNPANETERANLQTRVQELTARKEQLEAQLAKESQEFATAQKFTTLAELQAVLPKNAVLIDCFAYEQQIPANATNKTKEIWEPCLAAFIIPAQGEIQFIDLGLAKPVQEQLTLWLGPGRSDLGKSAAAQAAGLKLREQLWVPLTKYLPSTAAGEVPLVLLSPDGVLNQIPWNALPGAKPGTYLLEEAALTIIPVPQLLPQLIKPVTPARKPTGNLLVLGDVDYDQAGVAAVPEKPKKQFGALAAAPRDASASKFAKLPGTQGELATLEKLYRDTFGAEGMTALQQQGASKTAVQQAAPKHLYLHFATHGFFAAEKFQKLLEVKPEREAFQSEQRSTASINPNLLSGIVLAGANVPKDDDDGILTAEEVLGLELRGVQLATLSACETGLGTTTSGEGLLGLQRAFQVAGCQTVVASQWAVDDAATRDLMERFYTNMWTKDMPKLAALREAQLWLLRERGPRGLTKVKANPDNPTATSLDPASKVLPPEFWAAFILSGDWR